MVEKISLFKIQALIYLIFKVYICSSNPVVGQKSPNWYRSITNSQWKVGISSNLPRNPRYLQLAMKFILENSKPGVPDNVTESTIDLINAERTCDTPLVISSQNIPYKSITVDVELRTVNTARSWGIFAKFRYTITPGAENHLQKLIDQEGRVEILTVFKQNSAEFIPSSQQIPSGGLVGVLIYNPQENNQKLCVITENNRVVLITPIYSQNRMPIYQISGITAYYHFENNRTIAFARSFTAYGCGEHKPEDANVRFIKEKEDINMVFAVEKVNSEESKMMNYDEFERKAKFSLQSGFLVALNHVDAYNPSKVKIFLSPVKVVEHSCANEIKKLSYMSIFNMHWFDIYYGKMKDTTGIERRGRIPEHTAVVC